MIMTGSPKSFLTGFAQGAATAWIGHGLFKGIDTGLGKPGYFGKAIAHGVLGGSANAVRGGKFGPGFLASGFSSLAGPIGKSWGFSANLVKSAVIGGTASVLGGGKFTNGAVNASFTYLFNDALKVYDRRGAQGNGHLGEISVDGTGRAFFTQLNGDGTITLEYYPGNVDVDATGDLTELGIDQLKAWATPLVSYGNVVNDIHIVVFPEADNFLAAEKLATETQINYRIYKTRIENLGFEERRGAKQSQYCLFTNNCGDYANRVCKAAGCTGTSGTWRPNGQLREEQE